MRYYISLTGLVIVQFISCSVRGVFSSLFCDCGPEFIVLDTNGEEPMQSFIASITKVLSYYVYVCTPCKVKMYVHVVIIILNPLP